MGMWKEYDLCVFSVKRKQVGLDCLPLCLPNISEHQFVLWPEVIFLHKLRWRAFSVVLFCSHRGIQGKKCGTIIVKAEELNNCRVSVYPLSQKYVAAFSKCNCESQHKWNHHITAVIILFFRNQLWCSSVETSWTKRISLENQTPSLSSTEAMRTARELFLYSSPVVFFPPLCFHVCCNPVLHPEEIGFIDLSQIECQAPCAEICGSC